MVALAAPAANAVPTPASVTEPRDRELATDYPTADELRDKAIMEPLVTALSEATGDEGGTVTTIDGQVNGFAGFKVDNGQHHIDLYWVGDVAPSVERMFADHPEVTVTTHSAQYSLVEMIAARDAIADNYTKLAGSNGELVRVGPDYQGRGIKLGIKAPNDLLRSDQVEQAVSRITTVEVHSIEIGEDQGVELFVGGRQTDVSAHHGGAGVVITDLSGGQANYCTTGVSVEGRSTGNKYMTTAIHCMEKTGQPDVEKGPNGYVYNAAGTYIGTWKWTAGQLQKNRHAILIRLKAGSTNAGKAYWGPNTGNTPLNVNGTTTSPMGDSVCTHGANTGAHCGGIVTDKNFTVIHGGVSVVNMVEAKHPTSLMAGQGDSGGPVSIVKSTNNRPVAGFILGAPPGTSSTANCGGLTLIIPGQCSKTVWYTGGVNSYLDSLNVDLR